MGRKNLKFQGKSIYNRSQTIQTVKKFECAYGNIKLINGTDFTDNSSKLLKRAALLAQPQETCDIDFG